MSSVDPVYVGTQAVNELITYCQRHQLQRLSLVADTNTYQALGGRVEAALKENGFDVKSIILEGEEVVVDAHYLLDTLIGAPIGETTYLAVGSGTLTDISRFISHRTGHSFISLPTAPSVDGFTSIGAPLIVKGVKRTILSQPPLALFADLQTLSEAPHRLVAAGYGDMIGKITALADWALGAILWDEGFDQTIYDRSQAAIELCIANRFEIARQSLDGVAALMQALIESGFCMLDFGNSNPASGAEHHASHYWEMKLLREGRPALLHGAKVGFATIQVARRYVSIRALSRDELRNRLEAATLPDRDAEIAALEKGYGALADEVIQEHAAFLNLTEVDLRQLKQRIADCWDDVLQIAGRVPPPDIIAEYLDEVGAPTDHETLGLSAEEVRQGFEYGHYLRKRFTVMKLSRVLNLPLF